jgi:hypothetical protein
MRGLAFSCDRNNTKIGLSLSVSNHFLSSFHCFLASLPPIFSNLLSFLALSFSKFIFLTPSSTLHTYFYVYFPSPLSPSFFSFFIFLRSFDTSDQPIPPVSYLFCFPILCSSRLVFFFLLFIPFSLFSLFSSINHAPLLYPPILKSLHFSLFYSYINTNSPLCVTIFNNQQTNTTSICS